MLVAKDSFSGEHEGVTFVVRKGTTIDERHPIARKFPQEFRASSADMPWEEGTANVVRSVTPAIVERADEDMPMYQLKKMAKDVGVPDYGTKEQIANRINAKGV